MSTSETGARAARAANSRFCLSSSIHDLMRGAFQNQPSTFRLLESQDAARPDPGVQITAMKATAVADLHAGGGAVFSLT
jgi:hypothetical protein